jgi:hypothetical protein
MSSLSTEILKSIRMNIRSLHVPNRVFQGPVSHLVEVSALVIGVEFWPWQWVALKHVESEDTDVCTALNVLAKYLKAMV